MHFHVQMINDPATAGRRPKSTPAHWAYLNENAAHILARGPTVADDNDNESTGSAFFVEFPDWAAVRAFIDNEPHNNNGIYKEIHVNRWEHALGRSQSDFPAEQGRLHWYVRGYGVRGNSERFNAVADAQREYFARHDRKFIVRGAILDDQGKEWLGSASLIALPTRKDVEALIAEEPFSRAGFYENILVQRHKFGGTPGQSK
jgi:uncharacterized protein YciI